MEFARAPRIRGSKRFAKRIPPPKKVSRFSGLLAIKRKKTLETKFHYFTDDRLEISFLGVLSNVRSHTPTHSKVHIGAGEI